MDALVVPADPREPVRVIDLDAGGDQVKNLQSELGGVFDIVGPTNAEVAHVSLQESIMKMVGYGRYSTAEQASNGMSIEVQRRAVERVTETNGWEMTWLADEGVSRAVPPESRRRFKAALALLEAGEAEALIFTNVDRASRCTEDFARLIRLSEEHDWRLIVTEMGIDTRTPTGKAMAQIAVVFAELERYFIRSRAREALAVRKAARHLNKDAVPTARGARSWSQSTIRALLMREGVPFADRSTLPG